MSASAFDEHLKQAVRQGLEINPNLERRQVGGVWGMYATADIAVGELLARFPKRSLLQPQAKSYGPHVSPSVRMIHTAAQEMQKGAASPFAYLFDLHESLVQMQQYSTFFYGEAELAQLRALSPHLADVIVQENLRWQSVLKALLEFDATLDEATVITTLLNFSSRGIGRSGFVPVLDCFNHSCSKGSFIDDAGDAVKYVARVSYQPGEQVYVFYGWLDLYDHAIHYNYFDPSDQHFIRFGCREFVPLLNEQLRALYQHFSQKYPTRLLNAGRQQLFQFHDPELLLGELGPTPKLQQFLVDYGVQPNESRTARAVMTDTLRIWLDALERGNRIDASKSIVLPASLRRFEGVLRKEKQLIAQTRAWLASVS